MGLVFDGDGDDIMCDGSDFAQMSLLLSMGVLLVKVGLSVMIVDLIGVCELWGDAVSVQGVREMGNRLSSTPSIYT